MVCVPRTAMTTSLIGIICHLALRQGTLAWTPIGYVDPSYAISHQPSADTSAAQDGIIQAADHAAKHGPWSAQSGDTKASSGDPADYFSWAEIQPDCQNVSSTNSASGSSVSSSATLSLTNSTSSTGDLAYAAETTMPSSSDRRKRSHPKRMDDNGDQGLFGHRNGHNAARKTSTIVTSDIKPTIAATSSTATPTTSSSATTPTCSASPGNGAKGNQSLSGPRAMDESPEGILMNTVAYALTSKQVYADTAVSFLRTLFVDKPINPAATFAGVPPKSANDTGTIDGLMDFRGLVKISNALSILRQMGKMDEEVDQGVKDWSGRFLSWLEESDRGRHASIAQGHLTTFYHAQGVSLHLIMRHEGSAKSVLEQFFKSVWVDQVDMDGRQKYEDGAGSFESACLNLQGVISLAKIGSTLGTNYWNDGSSGTGTIKSAVDYLLRTSSGGDDQLLAPHVATVKAVYGDSDGIYSAFLEAKGGDYKRQPWWFFDQPEAFHLTATAEPQAESQAVSAQSSTSAYSAVDMNVTQVSTTSTASATAAGGKESKASETPQSITSKSSSPTKRSMLEASQAADAKVIIELGHMNPLTSSRASITSTSSSSSSSSSAIWTSSVTTSSKTFTRISTSPSSTSSIPVFQTSPGPVPPSPPNEECRVSASDSTSCVYSWTSTVSASPSTTPAGIRVEAEQSAGIKLIG